MIKRNNPPKSWNKKIEKPTSLEDVAQNLEGEEKQIKFRPTMTYDEYCGNYSPCQAHDAASEAEEKKSRVFETGAKRDSNKGKIRPDLISPVFLKALGKVLATGADKYGERNWEKGFPQECFKESAARHFVQWLNDETDEDHAANLAFNIMGWIHNRDKNLNK